MDFLGIHVPTVQIYDNLFMILKRMQVWNLFFEKGAQADPRPQGRNEDTEGVFLCLPYMAKKKLPEP